MKDCKVCGMNYDQKEFKVCPYCGQVEEEVKAEKDAKPKLKKIKAKAPIKADQKEKSVDSKEKKSAGKDKLATAPTKKKQDLSRPNYVVIGIIVLVLVAAVVSAIFIFADPGVTVPNKYATIQEAIDAATDGDEIVVQMGIYRENIDYKGKNITLRSTDPNDPSVVSDTIIDGGGSGIVVSFRSGEGEGAVLSGFTITRGSGIVVSGQSAPVIENCVIEDNTAEYGAGIYIVNSTPLVRNNIIIGNSGSLGGGIFVEESSPVIEGNTISRNRANMGSGIAILYESSATVKDNIITDNHSSNIGGGILVAVGSNPIIMNNTITDNFADRNGGGLYIDESIPLIEGNEISLNRAANGGGIFIVNCMNNAFLIAANNFFNNYAFLAGGALYMQGSSLAARNNIFMKNESEHLGGAIAVYLSLLTLMGNTFEGNEAKDIGRGGAVWYSMDSSLILSEPDDNAYQLNLPDNIYGE